MKPNKEKENKYLVKNLIERVGEIVGDVQATRGGLEDELGKRQELLKSPLSMAIMTEKRNLQAKKEV